MKNMRSALQYLKKQFENKPDKNVDDAIAIEYLNEIINKMNDAINWSDARYGKDKKNE